MTGATDFGTFDVRDLTVGSMLRMGLAIRRAVKPATSLEGAAGSIVRYLYQYSLDSATGERSCALVRFYATQRFADLPSELRPLAVAALGSGATPSPSLRCLTLMATAGDEPEWNDRRLSRAHQAIPLASEEAVRSAPMIARLMHEFGADVESVISGRASANARKTYEVFHVEDAEGSPHIPAQQEFVSRYGIRSVVGFGGLLRSGELFALILFSRVRVTSASASRFRTIALDVRSALFGIEETRVWNA